MRLYLLLFLLISFSYTAKSQVCSGPGRVPGNAEAVCGTLVFNQQFVPSCQGPNIANSGCGGQVTSANSLWYKFHCYQSGTLGFLIIPGLPSDDYDWELMDVTGHVPTDVFSQNLMVSLNLSAQTGPTGCTPTGTGNMHCAGGLPGSQYNAMPALVAGHDYLLMVTNWSNSGTGYGLTFSGTAVLTDQVPPSVTNVSILGCDASKLKVTFSEDVLCSSATPAGSEYTITGGAGVITGITSQCSAGANSVQEMILNLQTALPPGPYNLVINKGTDGNTFKDVCLDELVAGASIPFVVPAQPALAITGINFSGCAPNVFDIALTKPVLCSSISASGSEFSITPGNPAIASVTTVCTGSPARATSLRITLQNQLRYGNYNLVVKNGTDGNTLLDTCGLALAAGYSFPLIIPKTTVAPIIQSIVFDECKPDKIILNFDKVVNCASISATGTEFSITPGVHPISSVVANCGANTFANQVVLTLQTKLPAGNFNVKVNNGTDGNTLSDTCFSFIAPAYTKGFVTTQAPLPIFDSVQFDKCNPTFVKVFYNHAIKCSSISTNGSDFKITGPEAVTITGATTNTTCTQGYTKWVTLQLSQPINTVGNYVLRNKVGTDLTGIIDTCSALQNINETIGFFVLTKPSPLFTTIVKWGCVMDTLVVSHNGNGGSNSWTWNFSDGTTATGKTVMHTFPVSTLTATVKLTVSNGACSDISTQDITLDNAFTTSFTVNPTDTICSGAGATFMNTSVGKKLQYVWKFGDNTIFAGQTPTAHTYTASNNYTIDLIATNDHGCSDTASKNLFVTALPVVSISGMKPQYCTDDVVSLSANLQGYFSGYTWSNGNGETFADSSTVSFKYQEQKNYTVTLTANDRFCGMTTATQIAKVFATPAVNLGADQTLCPGDKISIGIKFNNGYKYLWSTGAVTSSIITLPASGIYKLTVENHNCVNADDIFVRVLDNCLIKVPSAFTPNGDGVNDKLRAINADLATNFSFRIYNRGGQLMYSSKNSREGWDGRFKGQGVEGGTYVWQLSYIDPISKKAVYEKGATILIR